VEKAIGIERGQTGDNGGVSQKEDSRNVSKRKDRKEESHDTLNIQSLKFKEMYKLVIPLK